MGAGAWEIKEANSLLIEILHTDLTTLAWAFGLRNLQIPGREDLRRFSPFMPISGMPYDHGRNAGAIKCLEFGANWLGCLDSDVIPPRDAFLRLMRHNLPIVSGVYHRRSPPQGVPVMMKEGRWLTEYPPNALIEVDLVGAGCLLIRRDVLEKLPPQRPEAGKAWFDWRVDCQGVLPVEECLSEDFTFCTAVKRRLGIKVMVDTSVRCRHVGGAEADYQSFKPLECIPVT